ncbi:MAG: polysaccharide chain length determinant protein (PEP-CTERM system associated) [Gammaproteobacteria bacterium]
MRRAEAESAASPPDGAGAKEVARTPNPLYQELRVAFGEAEAEVAALKARVAEYQRRQDDLRKLVDTVPKVEAELARLNRDYGIDKGNYDALVQRREALKISDEASQTTDEVRFNVIEPPREPLVPTGPKRILFSVLVLLGGLAAGVGAAFLGGRFKPAFYDRDDCEEITRLPVLGIVSRVWTRRELLRRRMEVGTFAVGCVVLLGIFSAVIATHAIYTDVFTDLNIAERLTNVRDRVL